MITEIWKFKLEVTDKQTIHLPIGAEILCVQTMLVEEPGKRGKKKEPFIWVRLDPQIGAQGAVEGHTLLIFGTGNLIPSTLYLKYIGTFQISPFVWHLFLEETS